MFKFTVESPIVQIYVAQILDGKIALDKVPKFFNLRGAVEEVLKNLGAVITND